MTKPFQDKLNKLSTLHRRRALIPMRGIDFSSNDYLGLAHHDGIRRQMVDALDAGLPLGAGGSRLLRGNHEQHESLESTAADFFGVESSLFMSSGYLANVALFTALAARGDHIVYDEYCHASAKEGIHASFAKGYKFSHNDANACEQAVRQARKNGAKTVWIAVESVYSMDGDICPLSDIMDIAARHDAYVIVDEAHATGVWGPGGRGFGAASEGQPNLITLHTCGKALGQSGAILALPQVLKDYVINTARSFIYTTAPPPLAAVAVGAALNVVKDEPERRGQVLDLSEYARKKLGQFFTLNNNGSQIIPLRVGEDDAAVTLAASLQDRGFDVRAIRPPTVPDHTARLRISITLNVTRTDIDALVQALKETLP